MVDPDAWMPVDILRQADFRRIAVVGRTVDGQGHRDLLLLCRQLGKPLVLPPGVTNKANGL
jgi:hypothetical protein